MQLNFCSYPNELASLALLMLIQRLCAISIVHFAGDLIEHEIDTQEFSTLVTTLKLQYPLLPIISYSVDQRPGRYIFVGPEGNIFGVTGEGTHDIFGNWKQLLDGKLTCVLEERVDMETNSIHAHSQKNQVYAA